MPHCVLQAFLLEVSIPLGEVLRQDTLAVSPLVDPIRTIDRWSKATADES